MTKSKILYPAMFLVVGFAAGYLFGNRNGSVAPLQQGSSTSNSVNT